MVAHLSYCWTLVSVSWLLNKLMGYYVGCHMVLGGCCDALLVDEGPAVSIWAWKIHPYWSFLLPGSSVSVQGSINSVLVFQFLFFDCSVLVSVSFHTLKIFTSVSRRYSFGQRIWKSTRWIKGQYIFRKRDDDPWTGMRAATRWATRTTDFLPRRITIVAITGRGIVQTSSDEGLW